MNKYKSVNKELFKGLENFGIPNDEDYEIIRNFLPSEVSKEEIFVYSIKLCDNLIDRDGEFFSHEALNQLAEKFKGVTGIIDHDWKTENQHSRIYKTALVTDDTLKNESNQPYEYVVAFAYTLNSEKNKSFIEGIKAGILKEVSIGFNADKYTSVATFPDGDVKATQIDSVTDVYEWSFVAVPAQRNAGIVKNYNFNEEVGNMKLNDMLIKLKSFTGVDQTLVDSITTAVNELETSNARVKSLEEEVNTKGVRIKELEGQLQETVLNHAIEDALSDFTLVNDAAGQLARQIAQQGISVGEDGCVQGVDEVKAKLKSDYSFLFKGEEPAATPDIKPEDDPELKTEEDDAVATKAAKKIDFTVGSNVNTKSVTPAKKRGLSFN